MPNLWKTVLCSAFLHLIFSSSGTHLSTRREHGTINLASDSRPDFEGHHTQWKPMVLALRGGSSAGDSHAKGSAGTKGRFPSPPPESVIGKVRSRSAGRTELDAISQRQRGKSAGAAGEPSRGTFLRRDDKVAKIPKGWIHCQNMGSPVNGNFIFPMKVPLAINQNVPKASRFTPQSVLDWRDPQGSKIGMVIDFTFTGRYYNGTQEFEANGVEYVKLPVGGHSCSPSRALVQKFVSTVVDFWRRHPSVFVAVHCTHGLNRSGFMIISLLVEVFKMHLPDAINAFTKANPPGLWDRDYFMALHKQYGLPPPQEENLPCPPVWKSAKDLLRRENRQPAQVAPSSSPFTKFIGEVIIMRGLPGSGKSTYVQKHLYGAVVCSADAFFESNRGYAFDLERIGEAHQLCMSNFLRSLKRKARRIVVDNTNAKRWEYVNYVLGASMMGYSIRIVEIACGGEECVQLFHRRCLHSVPWNVVSRMWRRWDRDVRAEKVQPYVESHSDASRLDHPQDQPRYNQTRYMQQHQRPQDMGQRSEYRYSRSEYRYANQQNVSARNVVQSSGYVSPSPSAAAIQCQVREQQKNTSTGHANTPQQQGVGADIQGAGVRVVNRDSVNSRMD